MCSIECKINVVASKVAPTRRITRPAFHQCLEFTTNNCGHELDGNYYYQFNCVTRYHSTPNTAAPESFLLVPSWRFQDKDFMLKVDIFIPRYSEYVFGMLHTQLNGMGFRCAQTASKRVSPQEESLKVIGTFVTNDNVRDQIGRHKHNTHSKASANKDSAQECFPQFLEGGT